MNNEMVKIVIKAPNQMTGDQIINCQRLWSVSQLKEHLFREYPSHPKPEGQKLIYSGKLLTDNMIIKDVLKTFGGHEYNTIHLVCSIRESYRTRQAAVTPPTVVKPVRSTPEATFPNSSSTNHPAPNVNNIPRTVLPRDLPEIRITDEDIERYMIMIQRAYSEYITNFLYGRTNGSQYIEREPENEEPQPVEPDEHPVPQQNNNNNVEREVEDDVVGQRDWLEWIYIITRLMVLFSVVYFYSSPLRFFVVMTMALLLFNMDVERWRRRNDQPENGHARRNNVDDSDQVEHEAHELPRPHPFNILSTFVTSFFLSLIPEQRAI